MNVHVGPQAIDRIIAAQQGRVEVDLRHEFDVSPGDSPIEKILYVALYAQTAYRGRIEKPLRLLPCPFGIRGPSEDGDTDQVYIGTQVQVGLRRVDFVLFAYDGSKWQKLLLECDGHEFHERTKEQAAADRQFDRYAQEHGYQIYRFTGSELFKDPTGCAASILRWADKVQAGG